MQDQNNDAMFYKNMLIHIDLNETESGVQVFLLIFLFCAHKIIEETIKRKKYLYSNKFNQHF